MHAGSWHVFRFGSMSFLFILLLLIRALSLGEKCESLFSHTYSYILFCALLLLVPCHLGKLKTRCFMDAQKNAENKLSAHKNGADTTFISHINFFVAFKLEDMSCIKLTALQSGFEASFCFHLDFTLCACLLTEGSYFGEGCVSEWVRDLFHFGHEQVFPWIWHVFYVLFSKYLKKFAFNMHVIHSRELAATPTCTKCR